MHFVSGMSDGDSVDLLSDAVGLIGGSSDVMHFVSGMSSHYVSCVRLWVMKLVNIMNYGDNAYLIDRCWNVCQPPLTFINRTPKDFISYDRL